MSTTTAGRRGQTTRAGEPRKYGLDAVILTAPGQIEIFNYYYRGGADLFPLPLQRLSQTCHRSFSSSFVGVIIAGQRFTAG